MLTPDATHRELLQENHASTLHWITCSSLAAILQICNVARASATEASRKNPLYRQIITRVAKKSAFILPPPLLFPGRSAPGTSSLA